jgi:putative ABC transport system substrate-binding protein
LEENEMKKLSRILAVVSAAAMMLSLAACGSNGGSAANSGSTQSSASQTGDGQKYTIGICQLVQHPALDKATQGFKDALTEKLGEGNVTFNEQNANGDSPTCSTIINGFVSSNVDLILADAKTVGMLYCSGEPNSVYQIEQMEGYLTQMGYTCERFSFTDSNDVASVTQTACASSDVIYVPTDNTAASNTELIANVVLPAQIPVIAGEQGICSGCGVATLSIDYYDIGYQAGEMAYDVLVNGADISTMDVQSAATAVKMYNESVCQQLGLTMPEDYSPIAAD